MPNKELFEKTVFHLSNLIEAPAPGHTRSLIPKGGLPNRGTTQITGTNVSREAHLFLLSRQLENKRPLAARTALAISNNLKSLRNNAFL